MTEEAGADIDIWVSVIRIELFYVRVYHMNVFNESVLLLLKTSREGGPGVSKLEKFHQAGRCDSTNIYSALVD